MGEICVCICVCVFEANVVSGQGGGQTRFYFETLQCLSYLSLAFRSSRSVLERALVVLFDRFLCYIWATILLVVEVVVAVVVACLETAHRTRDPHAPPR